MKTTAQNNGIRRLINYMQRDICLRKTAKPKKLTTKSQQKVIQLFHNLLSSGFHLTEVVAFLDKSQLLPKIHVEAMRQGLLQGQNLSAIMNELGFSADVVTQLALAEIHGNTESSLGKIEDYLTKVLAVKKKLFEVATYPIILLVFLVLIMLGLKNYLLPQLEEGNWATQVIGHFPTLFWLLSLLLVLTVALLFFFGKRLEPLRLMTICSRLPFFGVYVRLYLTAYYAREWGNLIGQGIEMMQIVRLMQEQKSRRFAALGRDMEAALLSGQEFHQKISHYPFFLKELGLMIEYGQVKAKLGSELIFYAEEIWERFFSSIQKAIQLIQPLVFIFVAIVIVLIY
ncbi:competence type IV pilus assembly protein ComGB, partial [Streptococcus ferus]|uniref:competence type IV pilus assembly protein ComGB n=1 Tax=Streptococcus ferus TaxID=1345 RepID=UPI0035A0D3F3